MANGMHVMTPKELLDLLSGSNMNAGKAGARLRRGANPGSLLPRAQREFLETVRDTPRRTTTAGVVHPEDEAGRVANRRNKDEDLSPVELAWLQRLPLDPAAITFDDAVQLAALASSVSKMKTPATYRLVESVWRPVKDLHDERLAKAQLEKARAPLPDLPLTTVQAIAASLAAQETKFAEAGMALSMDGASQSTRNQTEALLDQISAHNALADALLADTDKQVAFEQAIDDASAAAKRNGKTAKDHGNELDIDSQKGRDNQQALKGIAAAYNNLDPASKAAAGSTERARAQFLKAADAMGLNSEAAKALAADWFHMPTKKQMLVASNAKEEADRVKRLQNLIDGLTGKSITIETVYKRTITGGTGNPGVYGANKADGGYISGPGGPRDDLIPAMLSNGEYVVNAAATARYLPELRAMNAHKFADGGYAHLRPMTDSHMSAAAAPPSVLSVDVSGLRVGFDKDLRPVLRGEIHAAMQGKNRYDRSSSIQMRRPR
jgi:hypothetical protein